MPALTEANVRHLLRRTEFVDRPQRVNALLGLASWEAAVDNVMAFPANPPSVVFDPNAKDWKRGEQLGVFWLDRMAIDAARPLQEKMAFFWHGHLCSELGKVESAVCMREQIDVFRTQGFGNIAQLVKAVSVQVAMLRYLDNNDNKKTSPNQNFGRELLELFLLGVGNYTESDVESSTAAWTGHGDDWQSDQYIWRDNWHDYTANKPFLGRGINTGTTPAAGKQHGFDVIDTVLGDGVVPPDAANVANRGRSSRDVAAEFLSTKLWSAFATPDRSAQADAVIATMAAALSANNFAVRPWVKAMLMSDEFCSERTKAGAVRSPLEYVVALLVATGRRADGGALWLMEGMGQRPLYPPNVSGWKHNGYWINASAMEWRARAAQHVAWKATEYYWQDSGHANAGKVVLRNGSLTKAEVVALSGKWPNQYPTLSDGAFVDRLSELAGVSLGPATRSALVAFCAAGSVWERIGVLALLFMSPEMQMA